MEAMTEENLKQAKKFYGEGRGFSEVIEYDLALEKFKSSLKALEDNNLISNNLTNMLLTSMNEAYFALANNHENKLDCLLKDGFVKRCLSNFGPQLGGKID